MLDSNIETSQTPQTQPTPLSARLSIKFKQPVYEIMFSQNFFVCSAPSRILVYSLASKQTTSIKVCTTDFLIVQFPPYIFACLITQFVYCYTEEALKDVTKIIKMKISKLNVKAICPFNKGYFMAGSNRSPLPGGNLTDKRTIYYLQNLTIEKKNKPQWEISIPKSNTPVSILQIQNPYLMCYCSPNVYIINPFHKQILLSFNKEFQSLSLLEGRYALNCLNMIGISSRDKSIISVDVQKYPVFGVELNEFQQKAKSICQSREGNIYACFGTTIYMYNIFKKEKHIVKKYEQNKDVLYLTCSAKNILVVLIKSSQQVEKENSSEYPDSQQLVKELEMAKSLDFNHGQKNQKFSHEVAVMKSMSFDIRHEQRTQIQVFML